MGRRQGLEDFEAYQNYLRQPHDWPSSSEGGFVEISGMVPRHAASALQKLLRWAATFQAGVALNISDPQNRVEHVRNTPLAKALAARAQGLWEVPEEPAEVIPRDMVLAFAGIIGKRTDLGVPEIIEVCEELATYIDENWTVTVQSR